MVHRDGHCLDRAGIRHGQAVSLTSGAALFPHDRSRDRKVIDRAAFGYAERRGCRVPVLDRVRDPSRVASPASEPAAYRARYPIGKAEPCPVLAIQSSSGPPFSRRAWAAFGCTRIRPQPSCRAVPFPLTHHLPPDVCPHSCPVSVAPAGANYLVIFDLKDEVFLMVVCF